MTTEEYFESSRLQGILEHVDPVLPDRQRMVLLAVAAGWTETMMPALPGLSRPTRNRDALRELERMGRIRLQGGQWTPVGEPRATKGEIERRIHTSKKLQRALDLLADPMGGLRARGLSEFSQHLGPDEAEALDQLLRLADASRAEDQAVRRRGRRSIIEFVERNCPDEFRHASSPEHPPVAPPDLLPRTLERLSSGLPDGKTKAGLVREIEALYRALLKEGEGPLAHWWQILETRWTMGDRGEVLWREWRLRLESFLLRSQTRLPVRFRLIGEDPKRLKGMYPVPDCGYGPWVDKEVELFRRFIRRFSPALGRNFSRDLWVRAHEEVPAILQRDHSGAKPALVSSQRYEEVLLQVAESLSGLDAEVLSDLQKGRKTLAVRRSRETSSRRWREIQEREALGKAVKALQEPSRNPGDREVVAWAMALLRVASERKLGRTIDEQDFQDKVMNPPADKRGGKRSPRERLGTSILRRVVYEFRKAPVEITPRGSFPEMRIMEILERNVMAIQAANTEKPEERRSALRMLEEFCRYRAVIPVVYEPGTYQEMSIPSAAAMVRDEQAADRIFSLFREDQLVSPPSPMDEAA